MFNPFAPQFVHRLTVTVPSGRRVERLTRRPTYDFQLEAFADAWAAVRCSTPPSDAVKTMAVIDALYRAAGLAPREPSR